MKQAVLELKDYAVSFLKYLWKCLKIIKNIYIKLETKLFLKRMHFYQIKVILNKIFSKSF